MLESNHRATLGRLAETAMLAAFLALSAFAYSALFIAAGRVMTAPPEFSDFYRPDHNPWIGAIIEPAAPQERLASAAPARRGYRSPLGAAGGRR